MNYFVISTSEDGDVSIHTYTEEELNEALNEEGGIDPKKIHFSMPEHSDLQMDDGYYIIAGKLVVPRVVNTVTKWKV